MRFLVQIIISWSGVWEGPGFTATWALRGSREACAAPAARWRCLGELHRPLTITPPTWVRMVRPARQVVRFRGFPPPPLPYPVGRGCVSGRKWGRRAGARRRGCIFMRRAQPGMLMRRGAAAGWRAAGRRRRRRRRAWSCRAGAA